jgi:5'-nucleotidase
MPDAAEHRRARLLLVGIGAALALACARPPAGAPERGPVHVRLLALNDFHGQLPAGRDVGGRPAGSAGVLAAWLAAARAGAEGRTLVVHSGDLVGASPPASALLQDEPSVSLLNLLANRFCRPLEPGALAAGAGAPETAFAPWLDPRCDVVGTVGNHELDEGRAELLRLLGGGNHPRGPFLEDPWRGARYPTLAANVVDAGTGRPILPPYVVKEVDGVPIGFVGLVLRETPTVVVASGVAGLAFLDEAETANRYVRELGARGVRAIVVLLHQGGVQRSYPGPTRAEAGGVTGRIVDIVARLDDEVDVVVSGHTHRFTNALLPARGGKPVLVTQAWSSGTAFARIDLEVDPVSRDVTARSATVQTTWADEGPGRTPDPGAAALQAAAEGKVAPLVRRVVTTAAEPLGATPNAAGESPLGDLIAVAQRAAVPGAQVALTNPGGIRADLPAGPVTWGALFTAQPFGNALVGLTLTGAQLKALLEQQWIGHPWPRILQVSGLSYAWSAAAPAGAKVSEVRVGGAPLDPAARYRVAVNGFLAEGGDGFRGLAEGVERTGGPLDLDALVAWLEAVPRPLRAPAPGRIVRRP